MPQKENITARCPWGKDLKSCCKTPFAASRTEFRSVRGDRTDGAGCWSAPAEPACSLCSPPRKKPPPLLPASALPRDTSSPGQAETRLGPGGSRTGLSSPESPQLVPGMGKGKAGLALPAAPSAGAGDVRRGLPGGSRPYLPLVKGSRRFTIGLTPDSFCSLLSTTTCPPTGLPGAFRAVP